MFDMFALWYDNQENYYTLKQNVPKNIYYPLVMLHTCTVIWKSKEGVTMTLPESETVDHPRKRKEKTQNTESHNTNKLEQPTQLERTITTPQYN